MIEFPLALSPVPMSGAFAVLSALALIAFVVFLVVAAERGIRRHRGNMPRRGREERNAAGRVLEKYFRW